MTTFIETPRFPDEVSFYFLGGPGFNTTIVELFSGLEQRNATWPQARAKWSLNEALRNGNPASAYNQALVIAWFRAMMGRAYGFRIKDWQDYAATQNGTVAGSQGLLGTNGLGTPGSGVYQLYKQYATGALSSLRKIRKPVSGTVATYANGVAIGGVSLNTTTGLATIPALGTASIIGVTNANPGVVQTGTPHGFASTDRIYHSGIVGMTQLNGNVYTITVVDTTHYSIGVDTSAYGAYTSGGTSTKNYQPSTVMTWAGQFDVPVRFDTDEMNMQMTTGGLYSWQQLALVELLSD